MRLAAGRALSGVFQQAGGGLSDRRLDFVADSDGGFVLAPVDGTIEARCDGRAVWVIEGDRATFVAPVPPAEAGAFALLPPLVSELLHPESDYIAAAFSDPATTDEELPLGCVRISGSALSIVYDRSIDVVHEYRRPDGLHRCLEEIAVVETVHEEFRWTGVSEEAGRGTVIISTTEPVASIDDCRDRRCFAAHLEHDCEVLSYWHDGPGLGTGGATAEECLGWARGFSAPTTISIDLDSGETLTVAAADW